MTRGIWLVVLLGLGAALGACDEATNSDGTDNGVDNEAPTVVLGGLDAYAALKGSVTLSPTITDNGTVTLVELKVDGEVVASADAEPFELTFDTTKTPDGLVNVAIKATDAAGNTTELFPVRVGIINNGFAPTLENGGAGEFVVPDDFDGTQEVDVKHHWVLDTAYTKAIGVIVWTVPDGQDFWEIELDLGEGACPHAGVTYGEGVFGQEGVAEAEVIPAGGWKTATEFFIHARPFNALDHVGHSMPYQMYVFQFGTPDEPETSSESEETTDSIDYTGCALNSGYPCRCDGVAECEDGNTCVAFEDGTNTGLCSAPCEGEGDETSCADTAGFGLFGYCGAGKDPMSPDHCVVVCEDSGDTAACPPGFTCSTSNGVCML